jgi:hypothetical protein
MLHSAIPMIAHVSLSVSRARSTGVTLLTSPSLYSPLIWCHWRRYVQSASSHAITPTVKDFLSNLSQRGEKQWPCGWCIVWVAGRIESHELTIWDLRQGGSFQAAYLLNWRPLTVNFSISQMCICMFDRPLSFQKRLFFFLSWNPSPLYR